MGAAETSLHDLAAQALATFFEYLDRCTSEADRLIVTGEAPEILVAAGRPFAGDGVVFGAWYSSSARRSWVKSRSGFSICL